MKSYSDFVDRVFIQDDLLAKLIPTEPVRTDWVLKIRDAGNEAISGGLAAGDPLTFKLIRGALFYAVDAIHDAHAIFQEASGDLGSYWHGMMHRREGDFDNARYWFRRSGTLPFFSALHREAAERSAVMARQSNWDPYLLTGECEQARFGDFEKVAECVALQRAEFYTIFDFCWRESKIA